MSNTNRESCIQHRAKERMVIIRESYVELFDGDHCAAAVLAFLEFLTNGEMARMKMAEEEGEPWVKASMSRVVSEMMNHYSARSVQKSIDAMVGKGILGESQSRIGKIKSYLLDVDRVNDLLRRRCVIGKIADDEPTSEATSAATSAKLPMKPAAIKEEVESIKVESINTESPQPLLESKTQTSNPTTPTDEKEESNPRLGAMAECSESQQVPVDDDGVPQEEKPKSRWPKRRWTPKGQRQPKPLALSAPRFLREPAGESEADMPAARRAPAPSPTPASVADASAMEALKAKWNEAIPQRPVKFPPRCSVDPMMAERFDDICAKAKALIATGSKTTFVTLFSRHAETGLLYWQRLLNGDFDFLLEPGGGKQQQRGLSAEETKALAAQMRKEMEEREARTKRADQVA